MSTYGSSDARAIEEFGSYNRDSSDDSWERSADLSEDQQKKSGWTLGRALTVFTAVLCVVAVSLFVTMQTSPSAATYLQNFVTTGISSTKRGDGGNPSEDLQTGDTDFDVDGDLPTDISVGQDVGTDVTVGQDIVETSDDLSFTFMRDGYDPLIYFTPLDISIMDYAILEPYIGVMEPSADMTIQIFGTSDDKYYQFDVCSVSDTSNCQTGYIYTTGSKEE